MRTESVILANLIANDDFGRKVIPFLSPEYFHNRPDKIIFQLISDYVGSYNSFPGQDSLLVDLNNKTDISADDFVACDALIRDIVSNKGDNDNVEWLLNTTEKFCQDKAIYNAIMESIKILDDKSGGLSKGSIPKVLSDALGVSFDNSVGHDFIDDAVERFEFYRKKEQRTTFDLEYFNKITNGGLPNKTLNIALAGTGVGKSLFMCHCAAANLMDGKNVLYITLELAEERVAERIDANLLDIPIGELATVPDDMYFKRMDRVKQKCKGKLIIKEYPTASAGSANFRHLLNELKIKKNFVPSIIYIDYLNICTSSRIKQGSNVNSYTYIKAIAEELRGLAVEFNVPIFSATQTTRSGFSSSDVGLEDTSESFGLPATADFMFALITSEELASLGQIMVKQLKNRYNDPDYYKRFVIGVDKAKMRLYDTEQEAQRDILDGPVMDHTEIGHRINDEGKSSKFKDKFSNFT
jgi:archaellum biogenesis ATPase FlaH